MSATNEFRILSISQSIQKRFSTSFGVASVIAEAGLSRYEQNIERENFINNPDFPEINRNEAGEGNGITQGRFLSLGAQLMLKNGITPYLRYRTAAVDGLTIDLRDQKTGADMG